MENNIVELTYKDKKITLIPTAHVSKESKEMVERLIDEIQPDAICIELDKDRYNSLTDPDKYRNTDIIKIIKERKVAFMLVNLILANYQKKMASNLDTKSGGEMLVGIEKAKELNCQLVLADRKVQTTFKRVWANLNGSDKIKLIASIAEAATSKEEISEEELAELQNRDTLEQAISEVSKEFPRICEPLVDERDKYLAHKIKNANGKNIVAILGAAHTINIPKYINQDYSIDELDVVPKKKWTSKLAKWIIPVAFVVLAVLTFRVDPNMGKDQLIFWIIIHSALSGLFTLVSGGNILTILTSIVIAPISSFCPVISVAIITSLVQAYIVKPTIADFDSISEDISTLKGFLKNKVTRILLICMMAGLGSALATIISGLDIIKNFFQLF